MIRGTTMTTVLNDLFEPNPQLLHPEPWWRYERAGRELIEAWQRVSAERRNAGDAEPLHAVRDQYHQVLLAHLKILDGYLSLLNQDGTPRSTAHADQVQTTRDLLQKHYDSLFPKWQTLDDLEGILLAAITPSLESRIELAKRFPPPQSWYDEVIDPIEPLGVEPS
jgi:hypothetical protein